MPAAQMPATIQPDTLYRLDEAKRVTGWGAAGMRQARRNGLKVMYVGRYGYIRGSELIDYIEQHARREKYPQ